jgi:hypothetical protein
MLTKRDALSHVFTVQMYEHRSSRLMKVLVLLQSRPEAVDRGVQVCKQVCNEEESQSTSGISRAASSSELRPASRVALPKTMLRIIVLVVACLLATTSAFWPGECVRNPGEWALDNNKELDCALRKLSFDRSVEGGLWEDMGLLVLLVQEPPTVPIRVTYLPLCFFALCRQ